MWKGLLKFVYFLNGFLLSLILLISLFGFPSAIWSNGYCYHGGGGEGLLILYIIAAPFYIVQLLILDGVSCESKPEKALKIFFVVSYPVGALLGLGPCFFTA